MRERGPGPENSWPADARGKDMPEVFFDIPHTFDPTSSSGSSNILAVLRNPANHTVVYNQSDGWIVQLTTPFQGGIEFIEFYPPEGGSCTPGAGENPPLGAVDLIIFSDEFIGDIFVQFQYLVGLGFGAAQLI